MGPEIWVGIAAVFVSGGAIGAAGTLLAQWLVRNLGRPSARLEVARAEREMLRAELAELHRHVRNMDARLDFTERLLDGAISVAPPPARLPDLERLDAERRSADPTGTRPHDPRDAEERPSHRDIERDPNEAPGRT